ncbi:hypothetical protein [Chlamydia vaughanii]|uniref:hypothetical protein n=1 Tax=Chlamydia vaughanii TaxID=3112552 RepID=UPI0032B30E45
MMSSKRTSQLAMLSILLTFTHTVSHVSAAVPPSEVSSICSESEDSLIALESRKEQSITKAEEKQSLPAEQVEIDDFCLKSSTQNNVEVFLTRTGKCLRKYRKSNDKEQEVSNNRRLSESNQKLSPKERAQARKLARAAAKAERAAKAEAKASARKAQAVADNTARNMLKTMIVSGKESSKNENTIAHEFTNGPVLPIFVRPDVKAISQEEKARLLEDLAREQRISKRKSSREALELRVKENKIPRSGKITSTLRYDAEKAAAVKVKRNSSVNSQIRAQKASNSRRNVQSDKIQEASNKEQARPAKNQDPVASNADDYFGETAAAGNTNVTSYLAAKQYRCDSSETDWPCSSCVAKRRTHASISVCTMVVTVIAMIVGAIIIANASDSTATNGGTTPPTPPKPNPAP